MKKQNKKNKPILPLLITFGSAFIAGLLIGIIIVRHPEFMSGTLGGVEYMIIALGAIIHAYTQVAIHEAGHLVFGLMSGYKFSSFGIFGIMLIKENGRLKIKRMTIAGTGGQCLMEPPEPKYGLIPVFLYNMGGAIFNLIFAVIYAVIYIIVRDNPVWSAIMLFGAFIAFVYVLTNGIPMKVGGINNDGHNAMSLGKNRAANRAFRLQMLMNAELTRGVKISEMPEEWFEIPTDEEMKNSLCASIAVFRANRLFEKKQFSEAEAFMNDILQMESGIVDLHRNLLCCDVMYCRLIRGEKIDDLLTPSQLSFMKMMRKYPSVIRTELVIALLHEKDKEKAENIEKIFDKYTKSYPYAKEIESEREFIAIAKEYFAGNAGQEKAPSAVMDNAFDNAVLDDDMDISLVSDGTRCERPDEPQNDQMLKFYKAIENGNTDMVVKNDLDDEDEGDPESV